MKGVEFLENVAKINFARILLQSVNYYDIRY
jgi:hypothetical protein